MDRRLRPELMDDPGLDPRKHQQALRGLRRINAISGVGGVLWSALRRIAARRRLQSFSVLDVACGGGDLLAALSRRARRDGVDLQLAGCDISPVAIDQAKQNVCSTSVAAEFFVADAIQQPLPARYDFVTSTLFLHHLDGEASERLLEHLRDAATHAVLVDDLVRSRVGYMLAWAGCHLLSRSPIVHYDGPTSVLGAYTVEEARQLAGRAGMEGTRIATHWPCRFLMEWERPR